MDGKQIAERLHKIHTHLGIMTRFEVPDEDDEIIYRENDVIQLLKDLGHPEPDWDGYAKDCENE